MRTELIAEIRARRSGELFMYVNDAVVGIPGLVEYFYTNRRRSPSPRWASARGYS